jgi:hypothetical protein
MSRIYTILWLVTRKLGLEIDYLDLCEVLQNYDESELRAKEDCEGCAHYNAEGNRIIAEALERHLISRGYIRFGNRLPISISDGN